MKKKTIYFIIAVVLIISAMMLAYIYPFAKSEPVPNGNNSSASATTTQTSNSNIESSNKDITVSSAEELRKISLLGGTNSEIALKENPGLGIAKEFSVFAEEDVTFTGADTEGKVAAGGGVYGKATKTENGETVSYQYQIGMKNGDEYSADVIVGNGPVEGLALDYGYTDDGLAQTEDDRIIAYSSTATSMNLDDYTDEEKEHFVEADLIDFQSEFERLRTKSQSLASVAPNGYYDSNAGYKIIGNVGSDVKKVTEQTTGQIYGGDYAKQVSSHDLIVFKGTNEDCNIFYYTPTSRILLKGIAFDVPYGSKVVLNIMSEDVYLDFGSIYALYYPLSEEKLAEINTNEQRIGYIFDSNVSANNGSNYIRDENGNLKPFIRVAGGIANEGKMEDISENILINLPTAKKLELYDCGVSVLAPNADVVTPLTNSTYLPSGFGGYFLGTLVCKSYEGHLQFGSIPRNVTRKYGVDVNKIDEQSGNNIAGATLELFDEEGNSIHTWTSGNMSERIELESGTYTIKETKAPTNYELNEEDVVFIIKPDAKIYNSDGEEIAIANIKFIEKHEEKTYIDHSQDWEPNTISYFESTATVDQTSDSGHGIDWDSIVPNVENNEYFTQDGGKIVIENSNGDLLIPASETVDNKEIKYKMVDTTIKTSVTSWKLKRRHSLIKYNSSGKVEWAANIQSYDRDLTAGNIIETDDRYIITGGMNSHVSYVDGTQTLTEQKIECTAAANPGPIFPTIISVNKGGKIENVHEIKGAGNLDKSIMVDEVVYAKSSSGNGNVIIFTYELFEVNEGFPVTWKNLYDGLNSNVGNISKVSFEVDASNATQYAERDLYMIVAENAYYFFRNYGSNWMEFIRWMDVKDEDKVTTTIPLIRDVFEYNRKTMFKPRFYRQTIGEVSTNAEEVSDVKVKNVKVYWKEVQTHIREEALEVSVNGEEIKAVNVPNKHIVTTVKITKIDAENHKELKGATFGIYNKTSDELLYSSKETDENGIVSFENLLLDKGTYYVKELTAPDGYELSQEKQEFTVIETGLVELSFENTVKPVVTPEEPKPEEPVVTPEEPKSEEPTVTPEKSKPEVKEEIKQEPKQPQQIKQVQTGDTIFIAFIVLGIAIVASGATFVLREYYK